MKIYLIYFLNKPLRVRKAGAGSLVVRVVGVIGVVWDGWGGWGGCGSWGSWVCWGGLGSWGCLGLLGLFKQELVTSIDKIKEACE